MAQYSPGNTPLSVHRAFVVQFRAETDVGRRQVAGRVEHVVSGHATHFHSLDDLLAFIARVLIRLRAKRHLPPPGRRGKNGRAE